MKWVKLNIISLLLVVTQINLIAKDILTDLQTVNLIKNGLNFTYNYDFNNAENCFNKIKQLHPNHPIYYLLKAIKFNMEFPNTIPSKTIEFNQLSEFLNRTIELSNEQLKINPKSLESIFYKMNALSLFGLKYSEAKEYGKAMNYAQQTYDLVKIALKQKTVFKEFYFTSGLYNYYSIQYPESHPIIRPFMIFFQKGNKTVGLKDLEFASQNTTFSETEANYFLANIYFKYENKIDIALNHQKHIVKLHPNNTFFQYKLAEIALQGNLLNTAFACIDTIALNKTPFYQAVYWTLTGLYQLKTKHPINKSLASIQQAQKICQSNSIKSVELNCLIYLGLARAYAAENNIKLAIVNYKLCKENTSNTFYISEISKYLNENE